MCRHSQEEAQQPQGCGTPVVCDLGLREAAGSNPAVPMLLMGRAGQVAILLLSRVENFKCLE